MNDIDSVHCVKAVFAFKGTNNDELVFAKGDVITVTQPMEGGWWEGTLNGKTGWFPSNYVKDIKLENTESVVTMPESELSHSNIQFYHNVVLQNVIETEKMHVNDLSALLQKYIRPLRAASVLNGTSIMKLIDNMEELCTLKRTLLSGLEDTSRMPHGQRKVGGLLMRMAPRMRSLFEPYCLHHPGAIAELQANIEEINEKMEELGAPCPGSRIIITCLSQPLARLEKYSSLLKELERHIEESHIDRGDTQRAIAVYRELSISCTEWRKHKEMEQEIISSVINGWEGEDISTLGEVLHISKGKLHTQTGEKFERIMLLFPSTLLLLSVSPRMSGYHYEGKIPLCGVQVMPCEDKENHPKSFELSGDMLEKMVFACGTLRDTNNWVEAINAQMDRLKNVPAKPPTSLPVSSAPATQQPAHTPVTSPTSSKTVKLIPPMPPSAPLPSHKIGQRTWTLSCLCPAPPVRPTLNYNDTLPHRKSGNVRKKIDDPRMYEMDGAILRVIEAYCNSAKSRHTVGSSVFEAANVILPEEEKLIIEMEGEDSNPTLEEKSLVDTVYSLSSQVKKILQEQKRLRCDVDDERKARKALEITVLKLQKLCATSVNGDINKW